MKHVYVPIAVIIVGAALLLAGKDLWITPEQQAQRQFDKGDYAGAAQQFANPMHKGIALYRAGEFEAAAYTFARLGSAEAQFNQGNAWMLHGKYDQAIAAYQLALKARPGWTAASDNMSIAEARKARLARSEDDAGGTGGMLGADEVVIDPDMDASQGSDQVNAEGAPKDEGGSMTDVWLRRVQTRPADFLAARFQYQLALTEASEAESQ